MIVLENEFREMIEFFAEQRWQGFEYIGYKNTHMQVNRHDLEKFVDHEDALVFWAEDGNELMNTRSIYRAMGEGLKGNLPMVKRNGGIDVTALLIEHYRKLQNEQRLINNKERKVMETQEFNQENFNYLDNQVRYTGFTDFPSDELKNKMNQKKDDFEINLNLGMDTHLGKGTGKANASLKFSKSQTTNTYFFNKYDMAVERNGEQHSTAQTFYTNNRITAKEAYNLMQGRSVHKTLTTKDKKEYDVWLKLDFKNTDDKGNYLVKKYGDKHNFDLEETLAKYPIKELENPQYKASLIQNLQKGERQPVTLIKDGQEVKRYIDVNAQYKSITLYGEDQRPRLGESQLHIETQKQEEPIQEQQSEQTVQQNGTAPSESTDKSVHEPEQTPQIAQQSNMAIAQVPEGKAQDNHISTETPKQSEGIAPEVKETNKQSNNAVSPAKNESAEKTNNVVSRKGNRQKSMSRH